MNATLGRWVVSCLLAAALGLASFSAAGAIARVSEAEMVGLAGDIIQGTITRVEVVAVGSDPPVPKTVVTIQVDDALKGGLNKGTDIFIDLPVGRIGSLVRHASEMPSFSEGEEVVLFLKYFGERGYAISGGIRGKHVIGPNPTLKPSAGDVGKDASYAVGISVVSRDALVEVSDALVLEKGGENVDGPTVISLGDYKRYIRKIVKAGEKR